MNIRRLTQIIVIIMGASVILYSLFLGAISESSSEVFGGLLCQAAILVVGVWWYNSTVDDF